MTDVRPTLTTARIVLEPLRTEHLPLLVELDGDPEVMRYLLGRARTPEEARRFWAPFCEADGAERLDLGYWVGFSGDEFLGWWSANPPVLPLPGRTASAELGWRLRRRHWGLGLATEGANAVVGHCFTAAGLDLVWAETMAINAASRAVMDKLGMRHVRTEVREWDDPLPGADAGEVVYELMREDWLAAG